MPNFGYETQGGDLKACDSSEWLGCLFASPGAGTISSISVACRAWVDGAYLKAVLVKHSDLSLVAVGVAAAVPNGSVSFITSTFSSPATMLASTDYLLGLVPLEYVDVAYDAGATNQTHWESDNNYTTPTAPTGITHSNEKLSVYATYTLTGGSAEQKATSTGDASWTAAAGVKMMYEEWGDPIASSPGGRLVAYCPQGLRVDFDLTLCTHYVIEYCQLASPTDMTISLATGNAATFAAMVTRIHNAGQKALTYIYTPWDQPAYNDIFANAGYRTALVASIMALIATYGLDGICFDWESDVQSNWVNANFTTFLIELHDAIGTGLIFYTPSAYKITLAAAAANSYIDDISPMLYDLDSHAGAAYPEEWYGTMALWITWLTYWRDTGGINANLLSGGMNLYWRGAGSGSDNWMAWSKIIAGYDPSTGKYFTPPADSQDIIIDAQYAWGAIYGQGFNLAKAKAQWVIDNGFGGCMLYSLSGDDPISAKCQTRAISNIVVGGASVPPAAGGARAIRLQGIKMGSM